jgi:DNA-directed RNA polymerase specialized sigma24 family protein
MPFGPCAARGGGSREDLTVGRRTWSGGSARRRSARRLLAELTPDQADVLALRIYGDLSLPEVARTLGKPLTAVTSLQHRGLEALRKLLAVQDLRRT